MYEEGLDNGSGNVLELSFSALDADAKERFRRLGVLAVGALVSMEMLSYLWDQVRRGTTNFLCLGPACFSIMDSFAVTTLR